MRGRPDVPAFRRVCFGAALVVGLSTVPSRHAAHGEAGEPFAVNETRRPTPPAAVEEAPVTGLIHVARDPAGMEAARGARIRDALAKMRARRVAASTATSTWEMLPAPHAPPAKSIAAPAKPSLLIPPAVAAESTVAAASPEGWHQLIASSYAVWVAAIVLIGFPLASWLWRQLGRREKGDVEEHD